MAVLKSTIWIVFSYLICMASSSAIGMPHSVRRAVLPPPPDSQMPLNLSTPMAITVKNTFQDPDTGKITEVESTRPVSAEEARQLGHPLAAELKQKRTLLHSVKDRARRFAGRFTKRVLPFLQLTGYATSTCVITGTQTRQTAIKAEVDSNNNIMYLVNAGMDTETPRLSDRAHDV